MSPKLLAKCQLQQQRDYSPVCWTDYFDEAHDIALDNDGSPEGNKANNFGQDLAQQPDQASQQAGGSFRVYMRNFRPPYAPERNLSQSKIADMTEADFNRYSQYPTIVALHGGGYSGLTWAQFTRHIEQVCHCRLLAIDLRSHGDTKTNDDERMDIDTLVEDVIQVTHAAHMICGFPETPKLILIGHSMGGAIAIKCSTRCSESLPSLAGFVIIDVVEGTAKDALPLMLSVIKTRPTKFPSIKNAIEWSVRSNMTKNLDSARVSMPGNLLNIATGHLAIHDIDDERAKKSGISKQKFHINIENLILQRNQSMTSLPRGLPIPPRVTALKNNIGDISMPKDIISGPAGLPSTLTVEPIAEIPEEDDSKSDAIAYNQEQQEQRREEQRQQEERDQMSLVDSDGYRRPPGVDESGYCWRTDLAKTQPHWAGWFEGLSEQLLNAPVQGKFLLLAGIDRLDKTLTIGQMQGKFMMKVLPKCGHAVHEDSPERVAAEIGQFLVRNKFTTSISEGASSD